MALCLLAGACGDPVLRVVLRTPSDLTLPSELTRLTIVALAGDKEGDGPFTELGRRAQAYSARDLALPEVEWRRGLWFDIRGLDAQDVTLASAQACPDLGDEPRDCCVVACFCTEAQHAAGDCGCGSTSCTRSCE